MFTVCCYRTYVDRNTPENLARKKIKELLVQSEYREFTCESYRKFEEPEENKDLVLSMIIIAD